MDSWGLPYYLWLRTFQIVQFHDFMILSLIKSYTEDNIIYYEILYFSHVNPEEKVNFPFTWHFMIA